jgi:hypothetical protein
MLAAVGDEFMDDQRNGRHRLWLEQYVRPLQGKSTA